MNSSSVDIIDDHVVYPSLYVWSQWLFNWSDIDSVILGIDAAFDEIVH